MKAASVIITWTPDRPPYEKYSSRGTIEVTPFPAKSAQTHPTAVGACSTGWATKTDTERFDMVQRYVYIMIHQDNLRVDAVREQIMRIDEYRSFPFSLDNLDRFREDEEI